MWTFQKASLVIITCYTVYICITSLKKSSIELSIQRFVLLHFLKDTFYFFSPMEKLNGWMEKIPSRRVHLPGCWV